MVELQEDVLQKIAELEAENTSLEMDKQQAYTNVGELYYEKPENYEERLETVVRTLDNIKETIRQNYLTCLKLKGLCLCANCGNEVEDDSLFCGECGSRMKAAEEADENSIICGRCGTKNGKEKKFCTNCGQKLERLTSNVFAISAENMSSDIASEANEKRVDAQLVEVAEIMPTEAKASTRICPSCGFELPEDAVFCAECGLRL